MDYKKDIDVSRAVRGGPAKLRCIVIMRSTQGVGLEFYLIV